MPKHCSLNCAHTFLEKHLNVLILKQVVGPSKQTNIHMRVQNAVPTVWGSFGLAPTREVQSLWGEPEPVVAQNFAVTSTCRTALGYLKEVNYLITMAATMHLDIMDQPYNNGVMFQRY